MKDEGCDVAPITDWGTDTEALVVTVRRALEMSEGGLGRDQWREAIIAINTIASELEQERRWAKAERSGRKQERTRADTAEAEVTRMRENFGTAARAINALQAEHEAEVTRLHISIEGAMARVNELERERDALIGRNQFLSTEQIRADVAMARVVELETERDNLRDELDEFGEPRPGRLARCEARLDRAVGALREIMRHTGASNFWAEGDGCQARQEGEQHDNCRPVIFAVARAALAEIEESG